MDPILQFFTHPGLPDGRPDISGAFETLAQSVASLPGIHAYTGRQP